MKNTQWEIKEYQYVNTATTQTEAKADTQTGKLNH